MPVQDLKLLAAGVVAVVAATAAVAAAVVTAAAAITAATAAVATTAVAATAVTATAVAATAAVVATATATTAAAVATEGIPTGSAAAAAKNNQNQDNPEAAVVPIAKAHIFSPRFACLKYSMRQNPSGSLTAKKIPVLLFRLLCFLLSCNHVISQFLGIRNANSTIYNNL